MVPRQQVGYASHCLGAILTSQRVIITDGQLRILQSIATAERDSSAPHVITSMLWVGPALLMSHAAGRVELALLSGKRVPVCSLARLGSYVLAGATADSLILLQRRGDQWLVSTRKVLVGALLMQAWLCLLAEQHAYGTWPNVRLELQHLVKHFNVQPGSDVALAEALLAAGCGDLLRPCTHFVEAAGISRCAHAAASNDWLHATEQVLQVRAALASASACWPAWLPPDVRLLPSSSQNPSPESVRNLHKPFRHPMTFVTDLCSRSPLEGGVAVLACLWADQLRRRVDAVPVQVLAWCPNVWCPHALGARFTRAWCCRPLLPHDFQKVV